MKIPEELEWQATNKTLGTGGQADVRLVTKRGADDGSTYAMKVLRNVASRQARQRFVQEISTIMSIDHPSIVKILDHSEENDEFQYYVMKHYEDANTLQKVISTQETNPYHGNALKSLELFENIILAIRAYEPSSHNIVHRDINPKNILVLRDSSICLIDFGICQFVDGETITLTDEAVGTRNYTAPECEQVINYPVAIYSDIYSAAKVLWSAITSRQAFAREKPVFNERSMSEMFPSKKETWHLVHVFEKTIREDPANRFGATGIVLSRLNAVRGRIRRGFPPLEEVSLCCPSCGHQQLNRLEGANNVFGNFQALRLSAFTCAMCGYCFVRNTRALDDNINTFRSLG